MCLHEQWPGIAGTCPAIEYPRSHSKRHYIEPDRWWLVYVSLVAGCAVGCFAGVNAFEGLIPVLVGRIVTALLVGGGSQIVHAVVNKARDPLAGVFEV